MVRPRNRAPGVAQEVPIVTHQNKAHDTDKDRTRFGGPDKEQPAASTGHGSGWQSGETTGQGSSWQGGSQDRGTGSQDQSIGGQGSMGQGSSVGGQGWQDPTRDGSEVDTETGETAAAGEREQTSRS
jgi:hypothetical protein